MISEKNAKYALRFQNLLKENNTQQKIISSELQIPQQHISELANNKREFTPILIAKIASFYKITLEEFLETTSVSFINSPNANHQNANNVYNDNSLVGDLVKSKDDTNAAMRETIETLKNTILMLEEKVKRRDKKIEELKVR
jgi:transcriptional regulator with XRE-family HTH domain